MCVCVWGGGGRDGWEERREECLGLHEASSFMICLALNAEFLSQLEEERKGEKKRKKNEIGRASNNYQCSRKTFSF